MIDVMIVRGLAVRAQDTYLNAVTALAKHYHRAPDTLCPDELQHLSIMLRTTDKCL